MSDTDFEQLEADFGEVMGILREGPLDLPTDKPSEAVWTAIAVEVGGDIGTGAKVLDDAPSDDAYPGPSGLVNENGSNVVSLDSRRSFGRTAAILTAVAAAILLVALPLGLALTGSSIDQEADLVALGGFDGEGRAELSGRTLDVDLQGLDAPEGSFYELWLLDFDGDELADLQSLGRVEADGSFTVPDDVDLSKFSVVDVSIELDDGNPDHSGDSVLRGDLADV